MAQVPPPSSSVDAAYRLFCNQTLARSRGAQVPPRELKGRVRRTFRRMCRDLQPTLAVEIGAHEADFSIRMKADVPSVRAVAFEANPYVHAKYRDRLAPTGVEYVHTAISQSAGPLTLSIPLSVGGEERARDGLSASISARVEVDRAEEVEVPSTPLDKALQAKNDDVVVAWIDVEGANGPVLESGRELLSRTALVHIEVESEAVWEGQWLDVDVARFFADLGLVPIFRDLQRDFQHNVVYAAPRIAADPATARLVEALFRPVGQ